MSGKTKQRRRERVSADPFLRTRVEANSEPLPTMLLKALLALGYTKLRWQPRSGGVFTAFDEFDIPAIIVVDVAPLRDGFPLPKLSPARVSSISCMCHIFLQDNLRFSRVRADYVVMPSEPACAGFLCLTQRRGVAWAFAEGRSRHAKGQS